MSIDNGASVPDQALVQAPSPDGLGPTGFDPSRKFADEWWAFLTAKSFWEDDFDDLTTDDEDYDCLETDSYDCSLEIKAASDDWRLSEAQQRFLFDAGFLKIYVNHRDGWETHYSAKPDLPVRGWRRRYVSDSAATTTNVIVGDPNPGYFEISFWPSGWDSPGTKDWLSTGYMRIVPDPLDPFAQGMSTRSAETEGLSPKDASPVGSADAPKRSPDPRDDGEK